MIILEPEVIFIGDYDEPLLEIDKDEEKNDATYCTEVHYRAYSNQYISGV